MLRLQPEKIAAVAQHDYSLEWQLPEQGSTELCSRSGFANDKGACSTHIHDIMVAQFSCEDAWAKRPVPADIDTPEENHESHSGIKKRRGALRHQLLHRLRIDQTNRLQGPFPRLRPRVVSPLNPGR